MQIIVVYLNFSELLLTIRRGLTVLCVLHLFISQVSLVEMGYLECLDEIVQVGKVIQVHLATGVLMVNLESKAQQVTLHMNGTM